MSSANDYSNLRGAVKQTEGHDYAAGMRYAMNERNWFKRARGEWPEKVAAVLPCTAEMLEDWAGMTTTITVVDGADGLTPDMLRVRRPENQPSRVGPVRDAGSERNQPQREPAAVPQDRRVVDCEGLVEVVPHARERGDFQVNRRKAFLVIVTYPDSAYEPHIGDISWTLKHDMDRSGWDAHTTEATSEMLAHHGVPYAPENVDGL